MSDLSPDPMTPLDRPTQAALKNDEQVTGATAGRGPTPEEEAAAERGAATAPDVSEAYEQALVTGTNVKGEGKI